MMKHVRPKGASPSPALTEKGPMYPAQWGDRVPAQARVLIDLKLARRYFEGTTYGSVSVFDAASMPNLKGPWNVRKDENVELHIGSNGHVSGWILGEDGFTRLFSLRRDQYEITGWYADLLPCDCIKNGKYPPHHQHDLHCPRCNAHLTSLHLCDKCNERWYPIEFGLLEPDERGFGDDEA